MLAILLLHAALTAGAPPPAPNPAPATWAVVVGVGDLADPGLARVPHGPADAEAVRDVLTTVGGVAADHVVLLADGGARYFDPAAPVGHAEPTRRNVRLAVGGWLAARARPHDRVLVFWSGQGATTARGEPLLLPTDAARDDLLGTSVEARWVAATLAALKVDAAALWLDTSFAGRGVSAADAAARPARERAGLTELAPGTVATWLAAPGDRPAIEAPGSPHGAFTEALLAALRARSVDGWAALVQALPSGAPTPVRLGRGDLVRALTEARGTRPPRERPELVLQTPHLGALVHAAFDPTGRLLATTGEDGALKLWSVANHKVVANLDTLGPGGLVDWSPDGERVAAGGPGGVAVWSAAGRRLWAARWPSATWPRQLERIQLFVQPLVRFSPDGGLVSVPRLDAPGELRDAATGEVVARLAEPVSGPIAWSPHGDRLAYTAADDKTVRVVAWPGLRVLARLGPTPEAAVVGGLAFAGDDRTLAVGRVEGEGGGDFPVQRVTLHDGRAGYALRRMAAPLENRLPFAASRTGGLLVVPGPESASIVHLDTLATTSLGEVGGYPMLTPDGRRVALYMAGPTKIFDTASGALVQTVPGEAIAVSSDLSAVLAGQGDSWGDGLALRDVAGRAAPTPMEAPARPILGLAPFGPGRILATEADRAVTWDLTSGRPVLAAARPTPPAAERPTALPSPDGTLVATRSASGVEIVRAADGGRVASLPAPARDLAWSPDGRRLAVIDDPGALRVLLIATGVVSAPQATGVEHADDLAFVDAGKVVLHPEARYPYSLCRAIAALPKARCLDWDEAPAEGASDVTLWDLDRGARHGVLQGHRAAVTGLVGTPDGKTLVSSSLDTTLRLWDVATARPLATVATLGDVARWVVTAPDGLFDGSPEGQAAMQWRVGDALFRLEQYAGDFYTPGLLAKLLAGERPRAAAAIEDLRPPPRVKIASPAPGAAVTGGVAKVVVRVDDLGGGASAPWLYVNGHRVPPTRSRPLGGPTTAFEVELVEGNNHLRATAFNGDGSVESAGDELRVTWAVPAAERPALHLLAVGVDAYEVDALRLSFATADARAIAAAFAPGLFGAVNVTLLLDGQATRAAIRDALAALARAARPRDAVLVYLAGHGTLVGSSFYYLPVEARADTDDDVVRTGLSQADLADALTQIAATKQIVILDACHSGAGAAALGRMLAARPGDRDPLGMARAQRRLARASGVFLVAAATASQKAGEVRELGHGVLTYAILSGLGAAGQAPAAQVTSDGQITVNALIAWLDDEVPRLTARHHGGPQNPVQSSTGQDFPIAEARP